MSIKFVIVGAPRTGSTLLVKTLNTLDGVRCHGELLGLDTVRGYEDGFDMASASKQARDDRGRRLLQERNGDPVGFIARALASNEAAVGFKALYSSFLDPRWRAVVTSLLYYPEIKFVHLRRHNSLRRFVSEQILLAGGPIHSGVGGRSEVELQVRVDVDAFLQRDAELNAQAESLDALLPRERVLDISYEELSADIAATVKRVTDFLGLATTLADIRPALKKVGSADLSDTVSNYQELLDHPATRRLLLAE